MDFLFFTARASIGVAESHEKACSVRNRCSHHIPGKPHTWKASYPESHIPGETHTRPRHHPNLKPPPSHYTPFRKGCPAAPPLHPASAIANRNDALRRNSFPRIRHVAPPQLCKILRHFAPFLLQPSSHFHLFCKSLTSSVASNAQLLNHRPSAGSLRPCVSDSAVVEGNECVSDEEEAEAAAGARGEGRAQGEEIGEDGAITNSLGDDTMLNILQRVPTRALLSVMALVCRRWRRLCQEHLVHDLTPPLYSTHDKPWGSLTDMQVMELAKRHASTLESIEFRGLKQLTSDDVQDIFSNLPRLRHLTIASNPPVITNNLQNLVHQLPGQLVTLDLHTTGFSASVFSNPSSRPLPPSITDEFVGVLCQRCPHLERLTLDADSYISEASFDKLLQTWPSLTLLHINSTALGWSSVLRLFQSCRSLQDLSLCSSNFAIPPKIEADKAGYSDGVEVAEMYAKETLSALMPQSLVSIRLYIELHVSVRWDLIPAEDLMRFKGHQLRQLHAQNSFQLSWHNISVWCVNLKSLDLSRAHHHNFKLSNQEDTTLCRLVKHLVQLEELALPAASDRILSELGRYCPRLMKLFFQGWRMHRAGPLTKQLSVTDRGITSLAEGCPELRVLSLGGCNKISTSSIRILTFHCKKIEVLELTGCIALTDDAIQILFERLGSTLLLLDLLHCTKLTSGIIRTVDNCALAGSMSLRVLTIPNSIKSASRSLLSQLNAKRPLLSVRGNHNGLQWDGFYHCPPWSYCT